MRSAGQRGELGTGQVEMNYHSENRGASALPDLPEGMRWVVLVDNRQIAVMLLEGEIPIASATECLESDGEVDYAHQSVERVEAVCRRLAAEASHQWGFLHVLKQKFGPGTDVRMKIVDWRQ